MRTRSGITAINSLVELAELVEANPAHHLHALAKQALAEYEALMEDPGGIEEDARGNYIGDNGVSFDDRPMFSPTDDGCHISAWLWFPGEGDA